MSDICCLSIKILRHCDNASAAHAPAVPLEQEQSSVAVIDAATRAQQIVEGIDTSLDPLHGPNLVAIGLVLAMAGLFWLRAKGRLRPAGMAMGIIALAYADLWQFGADYNPRTPVAVVNQPPAAVARLGPALEQGRVARVSIDADCLRSRTRA